MYRWAVIALLVAIPTACDADDDADGGSVIAAAGDLPMALVTPTTIVGLLEVSVEEGPVGADDISEINFGTLDVEGGFVLVEIPGDVVRAAGLTWVDLQRPSRYEVSVDGPGTLVADDDTPSYAVESLTLLD